MADATPTRAPSLLHNRNFILLWCAYGISAMGDHLSEMAILQTQNALDPSVDATPLDARMTFLLFVPFFLLAPINGFLADRLPRRALMLFADLARCVVLFFFLRLITWTTPAGTWGPFLPMILVGVFAALFSPARLALLPNIISKDQLVRANGMLAGLGIIATMAAMTVGGILADRYEANVAFRIDAATYLLSAVCLSMMILPRSASPTTDAAAPKPASIRDLGRGFGYVLGHRRVMELVAVSSLVWFCGPLVKCVIPAIVRDVYGGSFQTIGSYRAMLGGGFIVGAIIITVLGNALRGEIAITWGLFGIGLSIATFALSVFLPVSAGAAGVIGGVGIFGAGLFAVGVMASFHTLFQRIVPNRFRGRVFGVNELCSTAALLLATGTLGIPHWTRVDVWVGYILLVVAMITVAAGAVTLRIRLGRSKLGRAVTFAVNLNEFISKFWYRLRCDGRPTVPHSGAVIVTANHTSPPDPLLLYAAAPYRQVSFMVAEEYTRNAFARFFLNLVDCISVRRDGQDTAATKKAIRHLRAGQAIGIFIEGKIIPPGETGEPQDGVAMLALKTGAPVIPAFISGTKYHDSVMRGMLARHRACVRFGPAVDLDEFRTGKPDRATIRAATVRIYEAIKSLAPAKARGSGRGKGVGSRF